MTEEDRLAEIERVGDAFMILYGKCWATALDCYQRYFPNKEAPDRGAVVEMTNFLFSHCTAALTEGEETVE